ncbi:MAG: hypothetical protein P8Z68_08655 [Kineosporiaceae bacterium]
MNDEELRRLIGGSVPGHRDGFWEGVDRGLARTGQTGLRLARTDGDDPAETTVLPLAAAVEDLGDLKNRAGGVRARLRRTRTLPRIAVAAIAIAAVAGGIVHGTGVGDDEAPSSVAWQGGADGRSTAPTSPGVTSPHPTRTGTDGTVTTGTEASGGASTGASSSALTETASSAVTGVTDLTTAEAIALITRAGADVTGTPVRTMSWHDRNGLNVLLITRETTSAAGEVQVRAVLATVLDGAAEVVSDVTQHAPTLDLVDDLIRVEDCDSDGVAEATIALVAGVTTELVPVTLTLQVLTAGQSYVMTATGLVASTVDALGQDALLGIPTDLLTMTLASVPASASAWPGGCYRSTRARAETYLH